MASLRQWFESLAGVQRCATACSELEVERSVRDRLYGASDMSLRAVRADPRGAERPGRLVGGRYRLLERIGSGGMAIVYRARDERLKRDVAVKVIATHLAHDPPFVRRFRREAELCARLAHPNVVAILDAGVEPRDFIVIELVDGLDAHTLLRRRRLTPGETVHVLSQVCDGLAHAHGQDVVHHDVSPRNILIRDRDGTAKLADFGLASDALDVPSTRVTDIMGTPGYVAPEVLLGAAPSPRSDLHSLGVVAYECLAGPSAVRPGDAGATAPMATAAPRMAPLAVVRSDLSRALTDAVQQALAHEPGARQDSVAEFRAQLLDGQGAPLQLPRGKPALPKAIPTELPNAA
jgi:serine/threonine protein kinase